MTRASGITTRPSPHVLPFVDDSKTTTTISDLGKDLTMFHRPFEGVTYNRVAGTAVEIVTADFKVSWVQNPSFCIV